MATLIMEAGRQRAKHLFPNKRGGNFSAYLEWLIGKDLASLTAAPGPLHLNEPIKAAKRPSPAPAGAGAGAGVSYKSRATRSPRTPAKKFGKG